MELSELIKKYKQHFVLNKEKMGVLEAKELVSKLEVEPLNSENEEMMWKLRSFIGRQEYIAENKNDQEVKTRKASKDFDHYHEKLKDFGVVVVQPGIEYNGKIDYINMTYHYKDEVIYKWRGQGVHVTELAPQIKAVYESIMVTA